MLRPTPPLHGIQDVPDGTPLPSLFLHVPPVLAHQGPIHQDYSGCDVVRRVIEDREVFLSDPQRGLSLATVGPKSAVQAIGLGVSSLPQRFVPFELLGDQDPDLAEEVPNDVDRWRILGQVAFTKCPIHATPDVLEADKRAVHGVPSCPDSSAIRRTDWVALR